MSKIKRLAGETVLYGFGSIIPRFLNFLLVTLHTDVFAPAAYGVITKLFAYVAVINTLFMFGMETAYFRFANKPGADEKKVFNLAQTVVMIVSGGMTILFVVFAAPIASFLDIPGRGDLVTMLALIMFIDAVVAIPFARLRLQKKATRFAIGKLVNVGLVVGLNIYLLKFSAHRPDVGFVVLANLIANAFFIIFFIKTLFSWRPAINKEFTGPMVNYSFPIMMTGLAGITNEMFSRTMLDKWLPPGFYGNETNDAALGVFGACYKLAMLMNLSIQAFRYAAEPFFFSNAAEKNSPQLFAKINHYFVIVCCFILLSVSINLDIVKYFLQDDRYWQGLNVVPILLLANLILGVYYNFSVWFKLTDKTYYGTIITVVGLFVTIVGNYLLIPVAGYVGSSWASLLCYLSMAILCYAIGQRYYPVPYKMGKGLVYVSFTVAIVYLVNPISSGNQIFTTAFHGLIMVAFLVAVYLIERKELSLKRA